MSPQRAKSNDARQINDRGRLARSLWGAAMIVCSCTVITDSDIETALVEILNRPNAPIPTPGVVYRHLQKRMNCCGCAPLAVDTIYNKVDELERKGLISPNVCAQTRSKLLEFAVWRARVREEKTATACVGTGAGESTLKVA
jgi:hypothetical protein